MNNFACLEDLAKISQSIGNNSAYVQGGGGNTSIKLNSQYMAIKASGISLKDMTVDGGYSLVDYRAMLVYMENPHDHEDVFNATICSYGERSFARPSLETGFHALLQRCVLHSHSVYANVFLCAQEGKKIVQDLFPQSLWVDYVSPGRNLTVTMKRALENLGFIPDVIFLQNHGLVVSKACGKDVLALHEAIHETFQNFCGDAWKTFCVEEDFSLSATVLQSMRERILFPDQVIYTFSQGDRKTFAAKETLAAYCFILEALDRLHLKPRFLPLEEGSVLLNMESEKYRQGVLKNDLYSSSH